MNQIDMVWILFCSCMVLFMQAGFSCLEAGLIRAKNTINVVIKNTVDFAISVVGFALIGFSVMFGPSGRMDWRAFLANGIFGCLHLPCLHFPGDVLRNRNHNPIGSSGRANVILWLLFRRNLYGAPGLSDSGSLDLGRAVFLRGRRGLADQFGIS